MRAASIAADTKSLVWPCVGRQLMCCALQEPPTVKQGGGVPPEGWPFVGSITYDNVTAAYRPGLPPVLSNLSFTIQVQTACKIAAVETVITLVCKMPAACCTDLPPKLVQLQLHHMKRLLCFFRHGLASYSAVH